MPIATSTAILIGAGVAAGGTAISAIGQIKAGNAAQRAGEFNAQSAEIDASVAEQNASVALENAAIREMQHRVRVRRLQGSARAIVGASGVELEGSPLDVIAENERQAAIDSSIIRREGALEALAQRREAQALHREAQSHRLAGNAARTASRFGAAGTLLTGGYQVASQLGSIRTARSGPSGSSPSSP